MFFDFEYLKAIGIDSKIIEELGFKQTYRNIKLTHDEYLLLKLVTGVDPLNLKSNLNLSGSGIRELPDNLTVNPGYLWMLGANLTKLPENLTVNGTLDIRRTQITELPESLEVGAIICVHYEQIKVIPEKFKNIVRPML